MRDGQSRKEDWKRNWSKSELEWSNIRNVTPMELQNPVLAPLTVVEKILDFYREIWVFFCIFKLFWAIFHWFWGFFRFSEQTYCEFETIEGAILDHCFPFWYFLRVSTPQWDNIKLAKFIWDILFDCFKRSEVTFHGYQPSIVANFFRGMRSQPTLGGCVPERLEHYVFSSVVWVWLRSQRIERDSTIAFHSYQEQQHRCFLRSLLLRVHPAISMTCLPTNVPLDQSHSGSQCHPNVHLLFEGAPFELFQVVLRLLILKCW